MSSFKLHAINSIQHTNTDFHWWLSGAFKVGLSKALSWFKTALLEYRASENCEVTILKLFYFFICFIYV